jgi:uridine kinase
MGRAFGNDKALFSLENLHMASNEGTAAGAIGGITGLNVASSTSENGEETIRTDNGDVLKINVSHRKRAQVLFDWLNQRYTNPDKKLVIAVGGPSGSGKSEIGALISSLYQSAGIPALLVPCDNYPIRAPKFNDAHRRELFDSKGKEALAAYLGSEDEILFSRLGEISRDFLNGADTVNLRKINMQTCEITESIPTKVGHLKVLVFEGTWSCRIPGLSESVFLATDFKKTAEHRAKRARVEIQNDENRRFIEEYVLPFEQVTLEKIRDTIATLWLSYEDDGSAKLVENRK